MRSVLYSAFRNLHLVKRAQWNATEGVPYRDGYGSSSTFQYASLMNLAQLATGACRVAYSGCHLGRPGLAWSFMWASRGVRSAFFLLHSMQASTQFSHVLVPPFD